MGQVSISIPSTPPVYDQTDVGSGSPAVIPDLIFLTTTIGNPANTSFRNIVRELQNLCAIANANALAAGFKTNYVLTSHDAQQTGNRFYAFGIAQNMLSIQTVTVTKP